MPTLDDLPSHDHDDPHVQALHAVEREAGRLAQRWHQFPPLGLAARHRGVNLLEALEYHFAGDFIRVLTTHRLPSVPSPAPPSQAMPDRRPARPKKQHKR